MKVKIFLLDKTKLLIYFVFILGIYDTYFSRRTQWAILNDQDTPPSNLWYPITGQDLGHLPSRRVDHIINVHSNHNQGFH